MVMELVKNQYKVKPRYRYVRFLDFYNWEKYPPDTGLETWIYLKIFPEIVCEIKGVRFLETKIIIGGVL